MVPDLWAGVRRRAVVKATVRSRLPALWRQRAAVSGVSQLRLGWRDVCAAGAGWGRFSDAVEALEQVGDGGRQRAWQETIAEAR
jgi:hypothetical protein